MLLTIENPLEGPTVQRTVYVPVYSSIFEGLKRQMVELSATVSIRNVSSHRPLILNFVRYYGSRRPKDKGLSRLSRTLAPLATVEFVVQRMDVAGGPGANFLVEWLGAADIDEPIMEAVMFGYSGPVHLVPVVAKPSKT